MKIISITEAKTQFSKCIKSILKNKKESFVLTKNGILVAKIIPFRDKKERKLGAAKGIWKEMSQEEFNDFDIESLFDGRH